MPLRARSDEKGASGVSSRCRRPEPADLLLEAALPLLEELGRALQGRDWRGVELAARYLGSAAALAGARVLSRDCRELVARSAERDPAACRKLLGAVRPGLARFVAEREVDRRLRERHLDPCPPPRAPA